MLQRVPDWRGPVGGGGFLSLAPSVGPGPLPPPGASLLLQKPCRVPGGSRPRHVSQQLTGRGGMESTRQGDPEGCGVSQAIPGA